MRLVGRALAVWLIVVVAETMHGIVRTLWWAPRLGDFRARQVAVFSGSAIILAIAAAFIRWIDPPSRRAALAIGGLWLLLTLTFEIVVGRATGASWARIAEDYDLVHGGLLPVGMAILTLAPLVAARARRLF